MPKLSSVLTSVILLTQMGLAHAADGPGRFGAKPGPKTIDLGDGCVLDLDPNAAKKPGQALAPLTLPPGLEDTIFPKVINGTREITAKQYSKIYTDNREQQMTAARELAKQIGRGIYDLIGDPDKGDEIQELIMQRLGQIPQETFGTLRAILEGDSLAAINKKKKEVSVSERTDNALADIATALTKFRESTGDKTVDVNTASNFLNRLKNFGGLGKAASDVGDYVRVNYQNAVQVIDTHQDVLTKGILYQQHLQTQYRFARQESMVLATYIDVSLVVTEELKKMFDDAVDRSDLSDVDRAWVNKTIIDPIRGVRTMLRDAAMTNLGGYLTLGQLMDRNLSVIRGLYHTRAITALKMTIGAAGKQGIRKLDDKIDLINTLSDLGNQISRENVASLRALADRTQGMIEKSVANQEEMVDLAQALIDTIKDIRAGEEAYRPVLDKIDLVVKERSAELQKEGMPFEAIDKLRLGDDVTKEMTGRTPGQVANESTEPKINVVTP